MKMLREHCKLFVLQLNILSKPRKNLCIYFFHYIVCCSSFDCHPMVCFINPMDFLRGFHFAHHTF